MHLLKYPLKGARNVSGIVTALTSSEGDMVNAGDALMTVESSGETQHITTSVSGSLLKMFVKAGNVVRSGEPLAAVGEQGEIFSEPAEKDNRTKNNSNDNVAESVMPAPEKIEREEAMAPNKSKGNSQNVIPVLMPQAGQSMEEGRIIAWKVKEGDVIRAGQMIMEIETDKAAMDVEAADSGCIRKIIHKEGEIVEVKQPVALIADNDEDIEAYLAEAGIESAPAPEAKAEPAPQSAAPDAVEGEVIPVLMPQAGQSMEEGRIIAWKVKEGDVVNAGQMIMEIETDKAAMDVEAADSGRIARIVAGEGEIVEVKQPVAYLADESVDIDAWIAAQGGGSAVAAAPKAAEAPAAKSAPATAKAPVSVSDSGRVKASPAARKAASEMGVMLSQIPTGSGPGGRILSTDVADFGQTSGEERTIPLTRMRKAIANNLTFSKQNVPHFYAKVTVNAGALFDTYRKTKQAYKCSLNDFVTLASARALRQYPQLRSQYTGDAIIEKPSVNIGIAVGTDDGLTVPVLLDADRKNLEKLASYTRDVVENARKGRLEGIGQGIFTITNLGMFGVEEFQAIINPPEAAILAVGSLRESVVVENGAIKAARVMTLTLSVDHRVVDGVLAAKFLQTLKELLENPEQLTA